MDLVLFLVDEFVKLDVLMEAGGPLLDGALDLDRMASLYTWDSRDALTAVKTSAMPRIGKGRYTLSCLTPSSLGFL